MKVPGLVSLALAGGIGFGAMMVAYRLLNPPITMTSYAALTGMPTAMFMLTVKPSGAKYTEYDLKTKYQIRILSFRPVQPEKRSAATEAPDLFIYVTVHAKDDESIKKLTDLGFRETGAGPTLTKQGTNKHDLFIKLS